MAMPTGKLTPCLRSLGLSAWNAPWVTHDSKENLEIEMDPPPVLSEC